MNVEKIIDFDFKKLIPEQGSESERKVSKIVTFKFIALSFAVALGLGLGTTMMKVHFESKETLIKQEQQKQMIELEELYKVAEKNKEGILLNLEQQITMYDDIVQDFLIANQKIPNSAQTILNQSNQIRSENQEYKQTISNYIRNFNKIMENEKNLTTETEENKNQFKDIVKNYQVGSLNRRTELENILMAYTTVEYDEKEVQKEALPIRQELKKVAIDKLTKLLSTNDITKVKKMKY